ncbi:MAG TPA: hypothetical protein VJW17_15725 [Pyrinomonadaceae bacterium]|nr:hypothetical protein [Pyrinomonadaceae bacterium]
MKLALLILISIAPVNIYAQTKGDAALETQLRQMYSGDEGEIRYFLKWFDLNGDGTPEAIVHVVGPSLCGTGGCDTHIFAKRGANYKLISTIGLTRPLIVASSLRSHSWRNLIVFVAGGGIYPGYYAELRFNGKTYPDNPTVKPAKRISGKPRGPVLIERFDDFRQGKPLK